MENFTQVNNSLKHTNQQLRKTIASSDNLKIHGMALTLTRLYSMLLSVWCEARLHTLLYEDGVFNEEERYRIYNSGSVENKWKKALIISVEKHADLQKDTPITENSVGFALFNIYSRITEWLSKYFSPVIQNRNKIAHAQWVYPFVNTDGEWENSLSFKICQDSIANFKKDNLLSIEEKAKLLNVIAGAINSLAIGSRQSDYKVLDFDDINKQVQKHVNKLESINHNKYTEFVKSLQKAYKEQNKPAQNPSPHIKNTSPETHSAYPK